MGILEDKRVLTLDIGLLVAGTKYRGEFEERLKKIMEEIRGAGNVILVIDEVHTLIGAGAASGGTLDASNLLKPSLSSGQLKCIGATTYNEYRGIIVYLRVVDGTIREKEEIHMLGTDKVYEAIDIGRFTPSAAFQANFSPSA